MKKFSVKVRVKKDGDIIEANAAGVFHSKNPRTLQNNVNLMLTDGCGIRLFGETEEEAKTLNERILGGKATDLTNYSARRNMR